jgi:hypothetical protein
MESNRSTYFIDIGSSRMNAGGDGMARAALLLVGVLRRVAGALSHLGSAGRLSISSGSCPGGNVPGGIDTDARFLGREFDGVLRSGELS